LTLIPDLIRHQVANGGPHRSGTLSVGPLKRIEDLLAAGFSGETIRTAETGCGASTILFAHYSTEHDVYTLDDTNHPNSSVNYAKKFDTFNNEKVRWHLGPTQKTLTASPPSGTYDMVLIDGSHGYPWPEFEYSFFYRLLKCGGILIIDDIHIPTIRNMFNFLVEDDLFYLDSIVFKTAFFRRSDVQLVQPDGDNWVTQRYNVQQFPLTDPFEATAINHDLALSEINIIALKQYIRRGFTDFQGNFATEGRLSIIDIPFIAPVSGNCVIKIGVMPLFADQRSGAIAEVYINHELAGRFKLTGTEPLDLKAEVTLKDANQVEIKFHNLGLVEFDKLSKIIDHNSVDRRLMNFAITNFHLHVEG
jgi:SAM-dependent methyltransferase